MDAVVLVGGQGTRLRPLTATRHKSLVPLCNRPAIAYLFEWLQRSGFERAVLAIGQDNDDLAEAYPSGRAHGIEITQVQERERLESGGAIRHAVRMAGVKGRFVVLNGDVFVDFDFERALAAHEEKQADLTLALYEVDDPSSFGVAVCDGDDMVTGFVEKPPPGTAPSRLVNAGVWIFEPGLVDEIPPGAVRVEETLFPSLVGRRRRVLGYRFEGIWADIGTPARYLALNRALVERQGTGEFADGVKTDPDCRVAGSSLGAGCEIERQACVTGSLLWERVRVGEGAEVTDSILADGVRVGAGARITRAVIGSGARIAEGAIVPAGTSIEPNSSYDASNDH
jgi:mannose-1-phosphate guanylyltransferase